MPALGRVPSSILVKEGSTTYRTTLRTPLGTLGVGIGDRGALHEIWLPKRMPATESSAPSRAARATLRDASSQLGEYFKGTRRVFELPLDPRGTDFELRVWRRLLEIPYGTTASYGAIAGELGLINGARAVGRANGANPIPIVIPCHRVIGSDGSLVGYGGGLECKRALLRLEGVTAVTPLQLF